MRRREFISVIFAAAAWPLRVRAEQPAMPVIGFLAPAPTAEAIAHLIAAFRRGLAEAGYVEGKTLAIEYRFTNFRPELIPELAGDLVRLNMKVIFAPNSIRRRVSFGTIPTPTPAHGKPY
jgi:putative tryptophan/tyrosine transport system substrate-binding protein